MCGGEVRAGGGWWWCWGVSSLLARVDSHDKHRDPRACVQERWARQARTRATVCVGPAERRKIAADHTHTLCCLVGSAPANGRRPYHGLGPQPLSHLPTIGPTLDYP